jgi:hypothetical protein
VCNFAAALEVVLPDVDSFDFLAAVLRTGETVERLAGREAVLGTDFGGADSTTVGVRLTCLLVVDLVVLLEAEVSGVIAFVVAALFVVAAFLVVVGGLVAGASFNGEEVGLLVYLVLAILFYDGKMGRSVVKKLVGNLANWLIGERKSRNCSHKTCNFWKISVSCRRKKCCS